MHAIVEVSVLLMVILWIVLSYALYGRVAPWLKVVLSGALAFIAALVLMFLLLWEFL